MKKIISLENLAYFCILGLPLYLLRFNFFGVPINAWEMAAAAVILFWAWQAVETRQIIETRRRLVSAGVAVINKKYLYPIALIFFGFLISTAVNGNYAIGFGIIKSWFLIPLLFSLATRDILGQERRKNILVALLLSSFLVAIVSWGYYFSGFLTYDGRLQGFFNSPNYLAMFLAPGVLIGSGAILFYKNINRKELHLLALMEAFMIAALYLTYSYAAWGSIFGVVLLTGLVFRKINSRHIFLAALLFLALLFLQKDSKKLRDFASFDERSSLASRVMVWRSAGKILKDNWAAGIGPGNFQEKYLEYQKYYPPYLEWAVPHPHNVYLAFWLYGGFLGIIGFLWLAFLFFKDFFGKFGHVETRQCSVSAEAYIFSGIICYFLLHGFLDTTYFKNDLAVVFWLAYLGGVANKNSAIKN